NLGTPSISSDTHEEDEWISNEDPEFDWPEVGNATNYRYAFNQTSDYNITTSAGTETTSRTVSFTDRSDGTSWFHLAACNSNGCGGTDHYRVKIDKSAADPPLSIFGMGQSDGSIYLSWEAPQDNPENDNSGIKEYIVYRHIRQQENNRDFRPTDPGVKKYTGITTPRFTDESGLNDGQSYYYRVQAIDNAGNEGGLSGIRRVLQGATGCLSGITIKAPEITGAGEIEIEVTSIDKMFDADLKIRMPEESYETLQINQEGTRITDTFTIREGISGMASILVQAKDEFGNACEKLFEFDVDSIQPEIILAAPVQGQAIEGDFAILATVSDEGSGIDLVEAFIGGTKIGELEEKGEFYELRWNTRLKSNGTYTLEVSVKDGAGNKDVEEIEFTVDNLEGDLVNEKIYAYDPANLGQLLLNAGVGDTTIREAENLIASMLPTRRLAITRTDSGLVATIVITLDNSANQEVEVIEVIPKGVSQNARDISSEMEFDIIKSDPIIKFTPTAGESRIVYVVGSNLSDSQALAIETAFDEFAAPPIIVAAGTQNPIEFSPLPDYLWALFIIIIVIVLLIVFVVFLGGGFLLMKSRDGLSSKEGLHRIGKKDFFGGIREKEPETSGKFAYRERR
ncbi:MAG: Ig-like domain-containing protein, partial [archaeon]|nr:Ig-like domain-containing protein [archaeon]